MTEYWSFSANDLIQFITCFIASICNNNYSHECIVIIKSSTPNDVTATAMGNVFN